jgi:hypothetical protein
VRQSYRSLKSSGWYTPDVFTTSISVASLFEGLAGESIFSRGLPKKEYLQLPATAEVLRTVLRDGKISVVSPPAFENEQLEPAITRCVKNGWLYYEHPKPSSANHNYIFASPLHRRYVEWMLFGMPGGELKEDSLASFTLAVICKFSPRNLVEPRSLQSSVQAIPEAQFQDEFYCACARHTENCVVSFPEFGNKYGRIDFFLPSKKWGVELLRNGDRLLPHSKRFTEGEYREWIRNGGMVDYIILDFRPKSLPKKNHDGRLSSLSSFITLLSSPSEIENLYYIVYQNNWENVKVYNNKQELVDDFAPTY